MWIHGDRPGPNYHHRRSESNRGRGLFTDLGQVYDHLEEDGVHW